MRKYLNLKKSRGFVLLTMLLFLAILNIVAFGVLNIGILETKMFAAYHDKIKSFYLAEAELIRKEQLVDAGILEAESIDTDICGVDFYRVTATGKSRNSKTILQSVVARDGDVSKCDLIPKIKYGRQSFAIMTGD